eukprot:TRINITY_DN4269_c0_g1_i5.p1 TRINITY_DN4269_c0_g1~~TRINITY_DN4269_c0_g1_i5.p1  ORF type:complete len:176 (+),score=43.74 TRINITY_DN4269_c0_g1_i5:144-671(+)
MCIRDRALIAANEAEIALNKAAEKCNRVSEHLSAGDEGTFENIKGKISYMGSVAWAGGPEAHWRATFKPPQEEKFLESFGCHIATRDSLQAGVLFVAQNAAAFATDRYDPEHPEKELAQTILYATTTCIEVSDNGDGQRYMGLVQNSGEVFWFTGFIEFDAAYRRLGTAFEIATK